MAADDWGYSDSFGNLVDLDYYGTDEEEDFDPEDFDPRYPNGTVATGVFYL